jgi:mono/diheme cytochrome c family protein
MARISRFVLLAALILVFLVLVLRGPDEIRSARVAATAPGDAAARGAMLFHGGDFGGLSEAALETHAVPWRLVAAALVLQRQEERPGLPLDPTTLRATLAEFGFLFPGTIGNWPAGAERRGDDSMPLGMAYGDLSPIRGLPIRVANLACAACHAGTTYAADGSPTPGRAWLGMPNTSLDLEAYTLAVFRAMRRQTADPERLLAAARTLFPEMNWRERLALRWVVMPRVRSRLEVLAGADRPLSFPNGSPGSTNGVGALKLALGVPLAGGGASERGFVSIPDLGSRTWRSSLLVDGAYAVPGAQRQRPIRARDVTPPHLEAEAAIVTFFTVPSMGVHPDRSIRGLADATNVLGFLNGYRPQPFPGPIDRAAAAAGRRLYARDCAACHGSYDQGAARPALVVFPNWLGNVGTDGLRAARFDATLANAVTATAYRDRIAALRTGQYVAPPLTGLWASAPYLHNGSVPTIAALLDPASRPTRFQVGGHALDFTAMGLRLGADGGYPVGYRPWSTPVWLDTRQPGLSNAGHDYGARLSPAERRQLIEYLKLL